LLLSALSNITAKLSYVVFSLQAFDEAISELRQEYQGAHGGYFR
jgi:hypothetical protein